MGAHIRRFYWGSSKQRFDSDGSFSADLSWLRLIKRASPSTASFEPFIVWNICYKSSRRSEKAWIMLIQHTFRELYIQSDATIKHAIPHSKRINKMNCIICCVFLRECTSESRWKRAQHYRNDIGFGKLNAMHAIGFCLNLMRLWEHISVAYVTKIKEWNGFGRRKTMEKGSNWEKTHRR